MEGWDAFARAEAEMAEKGMALLLQRGGGEGFLTTVAANGTPRIHPLNVGVRDGRLLVFIQGHSAKARDLEANPHYALHAHLDPAAPHEFMVRGEARLVTDAATRPAAAADWFFAVSDSPAGRPEGAQSGRASLPYYSCPGGRPFRLVPADAEHPPGVRQTGRASWARTA